MERKRGGGGGANSFFFSFFFFFFEIHIEWNRLIREIRTISDSVASRLTGFFWGGEKELVSDSGLVLALQFATSVLSGE